ncbi:MAG: DUF58 domain-containing protein [Armatimonadota bacterium]
MGKPASAETPRPAALTSSARFKWFPGTYDIAYNPLFKGGLSRWVWRFCTHRMTQAGRWLFWPTVLLVLYGSNSLELQAYVIILYLFAFWAVALIIAFCLTPRVVLQARHAGRICAGETLPIEITVEQRGKLPAVDLQVLPDGLPLGLGSVPAEGVPVPALQRGEKARVRLGLYGARRGVYALCGYRVESDFPFGLFNAYRIHADAHPLLVYPQFTPLHELNLPPGYKYNPGGVALKATQGDSYELLGNREYQEGDNTRNIDWRATARLQTAILREYTQEYFLRVGVVLDTHVPKGARPAAGDNFERAVSVCASVSDYMARQDYLVDIFAAGPELYHLTAGQSLAYLDQILDILACVESNPAEPFNVLEPEILQVLGKITLVIGIFLDWNEVRRQFVEHLAMHGVAVKVIIVRDGPCTLDPAADPYPSGMPVISKADYQAGVEVL